MNKTVIFMSLVLVGIFVGVYYGLFGFAKFEPEERIIDLKPGEEIVFDLKVVRSCSHEIGIGFRNTKSAPARLREVFGKSFFKLMLLGSIEIRISKEDSETEFQRRIHSGDKLGIRDGGTQIKFIAGTVYLRSGLYRVIINVYEIHKPLDGIRPYFFATHIPKTVCG